MLCAVSCIRHIPKCNVIMHGDFATSLMLCASACRSADKHTPTILAAYAGERSRCARPVDNIGGRVDSLSFCQAWPGIVLKLKFVNEASDAVSHAKRAFAILLSHSTCYFVAPPASMSDPAALQAGAPVLCKAPTVPTTCLAFARLIC